MNVLFEDAKVQKLLDDYQKLVDIRIAVFDTEFNELYSSPKKLSAFCEHIRNNKTIHAECKYCDQKAFRRAKANKDTYIYKCHMGLYEAVTPLYDNEQIIGYVMIGQVLDQGEKEVQWNRINAMFKNYIPSLPQAKTCFYNLKQMSLVDIDAASNVMKACASSIWFQHIIDIERSPITKRLETYIINHLAEPLTTADVCKALNVSKTTIFNYLKNEYDTSLTGYINHIRLQASKPLLKESKASIAAIASQVGFVDYNYYSRLFKRQYGKTPREYRR